MGPKSLIFAPSALRDLDDIFDYIAKADEVAAEKFVRRMLDHVDALARLGHGGVAREKVSPGLRLSVIGNYGVYFRQDGEQLIVLRILHSRRDISSEVFNDDPTAH